jgi:hypothetical protein
MCQARCAGGDDLIRYSRNQPHSLSCIRGTLAESSYRVDDVLDLRGHLSTMLGAFEMGVAGGQPWALAHGIKMQNLLADELACACMGLP